MTLESPFPDGASRDDRYVDLCGTVSRTAAASIILASSISFIGWIFFRERFLVMSLQGVTMPAGTAFMYILAGVAIWFLEYGRDRGRLAPLVDAYALFMVLSGAATLFWYASGGASPDRADPFSMMSPTTALAFLLAGGSVFLARRRRGGLAASILAAGVGILGILGLMVYAYDSEVFTYIGIFKDTSFQLVLTSMLLGIGVLAGMKDRGVMGFLAMDTDGSVMARRLLPAIVFVPILFGLFRNWGEKLGLFGREYGLGLMVLFSIAALALLVGWNAVQLNRSHRDRVRSERLRERQAGELRRTAEFLEKIFTNIHLNIAVLDPRAVILRVNRGFANSFGHPADFFAGKYLFELLPDEEAEGLFRKAAETGESFSMSAQAYVSRAHPERGMTYWDWTLQPIRDAEGTVSELALSLADVTEKVRAESLLRVEEMLRARHEEELRRTADLLEKIFSNIYLNIVYMDPQFRILRMNQTAADHMGRLSSGFVGENYFDHFPDEETEAIFRRVVETGEPAVVTGKAYGSRTHPERGMTYWDWTLQPIKEKDGRVGGLLLSTMNVTERVQAQARLREREEAEIQQEKIAALGLMAAGIAHEIRNPLTGLNFSLAGAERLLAEGEELGPKEREFLARTFSSARSASMRIGGVIRRVMDFVRPGKIVIEKVNVNDAVREALELSSPMLRKSGILLEEELAPDLPPCSGDFRAVEQLVLNLVANAAQALEGREGEKRIVVSSRKEGRGILLSVADSGPGVAETLREKIFTPFYTTKQGGTGLGLSISRRIASDHGGTIRVEAGRLGGAEFLVSLPASAEGEIEGQR